MLVASARSTLLIDVRAAADAAAGLADTHRATTVMGRTLLQDALPTSLGLRFAGWAGGLDGAAAALAVLPLPVQMGGPVGHRDPAVAAAVARKLGLAEPRMPGHADRVPVARLATALGVVAGALSKPARDVTLMSEARAGVPGRGGSSAIAQKRNPVAAVSTLACTRRVPVSSRRCSRRWSLPWSAPREPGRRSGAR